MSSSLTTNPDLLAPARATHRVLVTGNNKKGYDTFHLPTPLKDVETCRLVYAQIPATSESSTAVSLRLGDRDVDKVQTAVPATTADPATEDAAMHPHRFYGGKSHFVVVPNGVEVYTPHLKDEIVAFVPPISSVSTVRVQIHALPSARHDLLDLGGDTFAILLELTSARRP